MAQERESRIRRQITSLISPQLIRRRSRDLGVVQRQRKVNIVALVYLMTTGSWCREALLVFDLAYYRGRLFQRIMGVGGSFLCRVKKDANFVVLRAENPRLVGNRTKDILRKMRGRSFECVVDYMHRNTPERIWAQNHIDLRLVAIWNP